MADTQSLSRAEQVFQELSAPIPYQWRVKTFYKDGVAKSELKAGRLPEGTKGQFLAYIDARDVFDRLDAVVGPDNWQDEFEVIDAANHVVSVTLNVAIEGQHVYKSDVGYPNSAGDEEPFKSAVSDGIKRAGVHFGIGRFLYSLDPVWVEVDRWGKPLKPIAVPDQPAPAAAPQNSQEAARTTSPAQTQRPTAPAAPSTGTVKTGDPHCEVPNCKLTVWKSKEQANRADHDGHVICFKHDREDWRALLSQAPTKTVSDMPATEVDSYFADDPGFIDPDTIPL